MKNKVLLIEDSPSQAELLKEILEEQGIDLELALTGEQGIEKALSLEPDLVLLDLTLPGIDGYEVCRRLRAEKSLKGIKIVILSVSQENEQIAKAFDSGADDFIVKTPVPEFVARKVKIYLRVNGC